MRSAGWHLLGTARMGADPATSVVDRVGPGARRRQPLRRRRQRLRHRRRREPDEHDLARSPCASPTAWSSAAPTSGCRRDAFLGPYGKAGCRSD